MLLNGQAATTISLLDRGLAYGDGLFETFLVVNGRPLFLKQHLARLERGCQRLNLQPDWDRLRAEMTTFLAANAMQALPTAVLKVMLTRTAGGRGYRPASRECNRILSLHPAPTDTALNSEQGIATFLCEQRLAHQSTLAGLKHLNRLEQVLASQEWPDETVQEGVMLDLDGWVIEGTRTNIFMVIEDQLLTPLLDHCGIAGVMREFLVSKFGKEVSEQQVALTALLAAQEVFVCNSIIGVWPVTSLRHQHQTTHYKIGPRTREAQEYFKLALADVA